MSTPRGEDTFRSHQFPTERNKKAPSQPPGALHDWAWSILSSLRNALRGGEGSSRTSKGDGVLRT